MLSAQKPETRHTRSLPWLHRLQVYCPSHRTSESLSLRPCFLTSALSWRGAAPVHLHSHRFPAEDRMDPQHLRVLFPKRPGGCAWFRSGAHPGTISSRREQRQCGEGAIQDPEGLSICRAHAVLTWPLWLAGVGEGCEREILLGLEFLFNLL